MCVTSIKDKIKYISKYMKMRACARACMCDQIEKKRKLRTRINNAFVVNKLRRNHTFVFVYMI